jgi:hypothetical protein
MVIAIFGFKDSLTHNYFPVSLTALVNLNTRTPICQSTFEQKKMEKLGTALCITRIAQNLSSNGNPKTKMKILYETVFRYNRNNS